MNDSEKRDTDIEELMRFFNVARGKISGYRFRSSDDPRAVAILSVDREAMLNPRMGCGPWVK